MHLLIATELADIGAIAAIVAVPVAVGAALWQVSATRARSRVSVTTYVDATWHMKVLVSNERGTNPISITSIAPIVAGTVAETKEKVAGRTIGPGETETWSFDIVAPKSAEPRDAKVRVDTGRHHWISKAEFGEVLVD